MSTFFIKSKDLYDFLLAFERYEKYTKGQVMLYSEEGTDTLYAVIEDKVIQETKVYEPVYLMKELTGITMESFKFNVPLKELWKLVEAREDTDLLSFTTAPDNIMTVSLKDAPEADEEALGTLLYDESFAPIPKMPLACHSAAHDIRYAEDGTFFSYKTKKELDIVAEISAFSLHEVDDVLASYSRDYKRKATSVDDLFSADEEPEVKGKSRRMRRATEEKNAEAEDKTAEDKDKDRDKDKEVVEAKPPKASVSASVPKEEAGNVENPVPEPCAETTEPELPGMEGYAPPPKEPKNKGTSKRKRRTAKEILAEKAEASRKILEDNGYTVIEPSAGNEEAEPADRLKRLKESWVRKKEAADKELEAYMEAVDEFATQFDQVKEEDASGLLADKWEKLKAALKELEIEL